MWGLRILNGTQSGHVLNLKEGKTKLGRGATADFKFHDAGVSKEHLEITVIGEKLLFTDLNSANGTFLNGIKSKGGVLKLGDKLSLHDILLDVVIVADEAIKKSSLIKLDESAESAPARRMPTNSLNRTGQVQVLGHQSGFGQHSQPYMQQQVYPQHSQNNPHGQTQAAVSIKKPFLQKANEYFDKNVMGSVYEMIEKYEYKYIVMGFVFIYLTIVTALSVIPMNIITSDSILTESKRRALTVARSLSKENEKILRNGEISQFSTNNILKEDGIDDIYVISNEGKILAPADRIGSTPKEVAFINQVRGKNREFSQDIGGKIGASVPILSYDTTLQQNVAKAYSIIIYNPGSITYDDGRVLSLFIQMFVIASILGAILFFFLYKSIEYPYILLNKELDICLKENKDHLNIKVNLPIIQKILTNLNSVFARSVNNQNQNSHSVVQSKGDKNSEYINLLQIIKIPSILVSFDSRIIKTNFAFDSFFNVQQGLIENNDISKLADIDSSFRQSVEDLIGNLNQFPGQYKENKLDFNGDPYVISCQSMTITSGEIDCYIITLYPAQNVEGSAA